MTVELVDERLNFHLIVLKEIFNGLSFSEIEQKYLAKIQETNYVVIAKKNNLLTFDNDGKLIGAYPVSPLKTSFQVTIENIGTGYCMCAIDSLGIGYTFGEITRISTIDKSTGKNIQITVNPSNDEVISERPYFVTYKDPDKVCNIAQDQCPVINFYSDKKSIPNDNDLIIFTFNEAIKHSKNIFSREAFKKSFQEGFKAIAKEDL